jgi:hypothetical protein
VALKQPHNHPQRNAPLFTPQTSTFINPESIQMEMPFLERTVGDKPEIISIPTTNVRLSITN